MARRRSEPVLLGKLIRDVIARRGISGSEPLRRVVEAFPRVIGPELAARTKVAGMKNGIVTIETDTAGLAYELGGFRGQELLERLKLEPEIGFVKKLRFRVGTSTYGR